MKIKIIALKKIKYSDEEDDYGYETNVISEKSEFCCARFQEDFQFGLQEYGTIDFNRYGMKIVFGGNSIDYCPYCGEKIEIELDINEELEYFEHKREKEEKYREYLRSLPPIPKKVIRKRKKDALSDYNKVFERVLKK